MEEVFFRSQSRGLFMYMTDVDITLYLSISISGPPYPVYLYPPPFFPIVFIVQWRRCDTDSCDG